VPRTSEARVKDHPAGIFNVSHTRLATALDQIPKDADILVALPRRRAIGAGRVRTSSAEATR
jgi:hypothetical protein